MNKTQSCLSANDLKELEHDQLSQQQLEQFEDHLTSCDQCREVFDASDIDPLPQWQSEICPALRETIDIGLSPTRAAGTARHETLMGLLSPSEDPRMLGRIGNYEVVGIIGQGGMGVVFKAFETSLNRFVAIKMLLPSLTASGAARKRFLREAQAAAAVVDDHVLPIFGVDQWQETPYLVMKYSGGQTLQQRIGKQGPLELKEVLRIGVQAAKGLAAAHAQGLVHRDVKPSNILLDGGVERAVLMDFGLARAVDDASITRTGIISGTPQYMSPEQVRADSVDARSDLFSLGSTLYAMCAGRPPFRADSAYGVMHRITHEEPTPICEVNSDVPQWMGNVIERLMSKTAEDRFESAEEVAQLLEDCLAHVQQPTATKLPEILASVSSRRGGSSSWGKWLALASAVFFLAFGGIFLAIELNKGKLVIECAADNVPIRITQGDREVEKLTVSKDGATVRIAAGTYLIEIDGDSDNVALDGNCALLTRGGVETVKIQLKEAVEPVAADWVPPENTNPREILLEAKKDKQAGNYKIALANLVWCHENNRADYNLLTAWLELGEDYPPALAKMREVRDATEAKIRTAIEARIRDKKRRRVDFGDYQKFKSLNRTLRQPKRTVDLFVWLEEKDAKEAKRAYLACKAALLQQQKYETIVKYIDPIHEVKKVCFEYDAGMLRASQYGESSIRIAGMSFLHDGAALVEILANVDREADARKVATTLTKHVEGKAISAQLKRAVDAAMVKKPPMKSPQEPRGGQVIKGDGKVMFDSNSGQITQTIGDKVVAQIATEAKTAKDDLKEKVDSDAAGWTPPENDPDPRKILDEAREDKGSGNYQRALAKHLWYHENAVRIEPAQSAVRGTHALSAWLELGKQYPPALAKMREIRNATEVKIRDKNRIRVKFDDFQDFSDFNRTLQEEHRTAMLFKWLDKVDPEDAVRVYSLADDALILEEEYAICGKYIKPIRSLERICEQYVMILEVLSSDFDEKDRQMGREYLEKKIVYDSANLVWILASNGRNAEARTAADSLKKFAEGKEISTQLEKAVEAAMEKKPPMKSPKPSAESNTQ